MVGTVVVVTGLDTCAIRVHILLLKSVGVCPLFLENPFPRLDFPGRVYTHLKAFKIHL